MKAGARFVVKGTVQGIFFRQFVKEGADELGLKGFCRNLESGDVEIVVEGEDDAIERLLNKVREGPKHAQIRDVVVEKRKWSGDFEEFKVLRF
jgi:acylphosphatase